MCPLHVVNGGESNRAASTYPGKEDPVHPSLKGVRYVIFPNNRTVQVWDFVMILSIWYCSFSIPFRFGISCGYYAVFSRGFLIFNTLLNVFFCVDTVLGFFRAYRDKNGRLVYSLKTIGSKYIRSGWFLINVLAAVPASSIFYEEIRRTFLDANPSESMNLRVYYLLEWAKLLRIVRIKKIMTTSEVMTRAWEKMDVNVAMTVKFLFQITLASHWIACIWGFIAYQQVGSFDTPLLEKVNWIGNWFNANYVEGGLNPIGWRNAIPRYWLCLFWAIQSITSIGYGNIAPVTVIEYGFSNVLMFLCGIFWAYIIGNLFDVAQSMGSGTKEFVGRMNDANHMVRDFIKRKPDQAEVDNLSRKPTPKRVRRFISQQRIKGARSLPDSKERMLQDTYPTLRMLSLELKQICALHLAQPLLETIPYLSSKYLSPEEQADVALQCTTMSFPAAERFVSHPDLGRGILILRRGLAVTTRGPEAKIHSSQDLMGRPIDVNEVLADDGHFDEHLLVYHFIGFTKAFFVPRSAIIRALAKNKRAWKECARWRYFMASFVLYSLKPPPERRETVKNLNKLVPGGGTTELRSPLMRRRRWVSTSRRRLCSTMERRSSLTSRRRLSSPATGPRGSALRAMTGQRTSTATGPRGSVATAMKGWGGGDGSALVVHGEAALFVVDQ